MRGIVLFFSLLVSSSIAFGTSSLDLSVIGTGDVAGPSSSVDNELVLFDGISGKLLKSASTSGIIKATSGVIGAAVAGTDYENPLTFSTPLTRSVNTISCDVASGSQPGCLSSTDWTTFNNKQAAGNYITALTGDVSATGPGSVSATIQNSVVTNAKMADMAQGTIKGRAAGAGTGAPTDLSGTQATAILDNFVGDSGSGGTKGLVPAPASGDAAAEKYLKADGTWAAISVSGASDNPYEITNCRIDWSVGSNNLTAAIKTNSGSDPSGGDPCLIAFRSATATLSAYVQRSVTAATSVTVPNGGTLGHDSAVDEHVCAYYIDNAGTVELGVSSNCQINESSLQTTTAVGTDSDSFTGFYSTSARTNVPIRLAGVADINQTTAGTYASAPTRVANNTGMGLRDPYRTPHSWTPTITGWNSASSYLCVWFRNDAPNISYSCYFTGGTANANLASISNPKGMAYAGSALIPITRIGGPNVNPQAHSYFQAPLIEASATVTYFVNIGAGIDSDTKSPGTNYGSSIIYGLEVVQQPIAGF